MRQKAASRSRFEGYVIRTMAFRRTTAPPDGGGRLVRKIFQNSLSKRVEVVGSSFISVGEAGRERVCCVFTREPGADSPRS